MRSSAFVLLAFCLLACGSEQSEPAAVDPRSTAAEVPSATEVIAESLRVEGDSDPNAIQYTVEEAECAAEVIVGGFDSARLDELGLDLDARSAPEFTQPPLTSEESDIVYRAFEECLDLRSQIIVVLPGGPSLDMQTAGCVADEYIASGLLRESLLSSDYDPALNDRIEAALADAMDICSV